jgi:hypothetical protein
MTSSGMWRRVDLHSHRRENLKSYHPSMVTQPLLYVYTESHSRRTRIKFKT